MKCREQNVTSIGMHYEFLLEESNCEFSVIYHIFAILYGMWQDRKSTTDCYMKLLIYDCKQIDTYYSANHESCITLTETMEVFNLG